MSENKLSSEVIEAIKKGRKIEAIKLLREEENIDLKQAHDRVNQYILDNPEVREHYSHAGNTGCLRWFAFIACLGLIYFIVSTLMA